MKRTIALMALVAALGATPLALTTDDAHAAGKKATKLCKHKTAAGKIKTWRCGADQPCCSAEWINYYTCGSKTLGCL